MNNHGITSDGRLQTIEIDKYEPVPGKPHCVRVVGAISCQEAFDQLEDHLRYVGMLPDEHFGYSAYLKNPDEPLPAGDREFITNVTYGASEGIYLDISLIANNQMYHLAIGKTLKTSTEDFIRMSRIAAECNLMLNGNGMIMDLPQDIAEYLAHSEEQDENESEMEV